MAVGTKRAALNSTLAAITTHPLRRECFMVLAERPASPTELAGLLRASAKDVRYHVKALERLGIVEFVKEREGRRKARETVYRAIKRPEVKLRDWAKLKQHVREGVSRDILQRGVCDLAAAQDAGTFDSRPDRALLRFPNMLLDDEGWSEMYELMLELNERQYEIQARSDGRHARRERSGSVAPRTPAVSLAAFFERAPGPTTTE